MQTDHYTYRVTWSAEDNEHVGMCVEFPSLSWLAKTPEEALKGIRKVVAEVVKDMRASGETVPVALAEKHYSGEFRVRIPPEVHRALATQAAEQGVSLNRLASAKLASTSSL
jgi:predicted HicB family RNase H-like nuclease